MGLSRGWLCGGALALVLLGCDRQISTPLEGDPGVPIRETSSSKYCKPAPEGGYASFEGVVDSKGFDGSHYFAEGAAASSGPFWIPGR
ncbi:MAG: hypothetical protein R3B54_10705 [Bdellovibrionota bacterium]